RAQELKAAGDLENQHRQSPLGGLRAPAAAPRSEPPAPDAGVVWDVEGERLTIAFDRARVAIERPVASASRAAPSIPRNDRQLDATFTPHDPSRPAIAIDNEDAPDDDPSVATHDDVHDEDSTFSGNGYPADDDDADDAWADAPDAHRQAEPPESPRASWWRSLNFGRKRRYGSQPVQEPWHAYDDGELAADGEYAAELDDFDDEAGYDITPSSAIYAADPEPAFATSEESWLQDEWAFPEPQPLEWHETRAQLLHAPAESIAQSSNSPQQSTAQPAFSMLGEDPFIEGEPYVAVASARPASAFFAIDEPSGMDAFRAALFEDRRQPESPAGCSDDIPMAGALVTESGYQRFQEYASPLTTDHDNVRHRHANRSIAETRRPSPVSRPGRSARGSRFSQSHSAFDSDFDIRDAIADDDDGFDRPADAESKIPKACYTCRSFQPSDDGERGWCMNDWSPTHRQMVNAGDLPCRSSIGDWWLAADASWIPPTNAIQPETPRTDRLVNRSDARQGTGTRQGRRVRTGNVS
ncbi:MAG: hypothetical protein H0V37_08390, partial [Chloroflexia bacterium]|nr:hypothetical protein [Chloroflexia bacterium]